jgi:hypothetical protein
VNQRSAWRTWPRRRIVEVRNFEVERTLYYVLDCGHLVERRYQSVGFGPGVTDLREPPHMMNMHCGDCHHRRPSGSVSPYTGRCEWFEQFWTDPKQLVLPGVG